MPRSGSSPLLPLDMRRQAATDPLLLAKRRPQGLRLPTPISSFSSPTQSQSQSASPTSIGAKSESFISVETRSTISYTSPNTPQTQTHASVYSPAAQLPSSFLSGHAGRRGSSPTVKRQAFNSRLDGLAPEPHQSITMSLTQAKSHRQVSPAPETPKLIDAKVLRLQRIQAQAFNLSPSRNIARAMLPPPADPTKMLLVLDVDETLVHASFTPHARYDVKVTINVNGERGSIYVAFRPHLREFLEAVAPLFEVAVFTASQSCYASPLLDFIDPMGQLCKHRLFREHCTEVNGARVKDLSLLGRPLDRMAIVDNSPVAYLFQPRNAIPILSWFDDPADTELLNLLPMLKLLAGERTVYPILDDYNAGV